MAKENFMHKQKQSRKLFSHREPGLIDLCAFLVLMLAFISSCSSDRESARESLYEGTEGLKMSLTSPMREYYISEGGDGSIETLDIPFVLYLTNLGRAIIEKDDFKLEISGFDPKIISVSPSNFGEFSMQMNVITLRDSSFEGISLIRPMGDIKVISGSDLGFRTNRQAKIPGNSYNFNLKLNLCYRYRTYFNDGFTVAPAGVQQGFIQDKMLDSKDYYEKGQGAPIGIIRVEVSPVGDKIRATFFIKKLDNVAIYYNKEYAPVRAECGDVKFNDRNKVFVSAVQLSDNTRATCLEKEFYLNENGEAVIDCIFEGQIAQGTVDTVLLIELEYDVFDSASLAFQLKKI